MTVFRRKSVVYNEDVAVGSCFSKGQDALRQIPSSQTPLETWRTLSFLYFVFNSQLLFIRVHRPVCLLFLEIVDLAV